MDGDLVEILSLCISAVTLGQKNFPDPLQLCGQVQLSGLCPELAGTLVTFGGLVILHVRLNLRRPPLGSKGHGSESLPPNPGLTFNFLSCLGHFYFFLTNHFF